MDKNACGKILDEIEEQVLAKDSPLCWIIARELADFTVAFIVANNGQLSPAGTGTLVSFGDSRYFLTATHVWEEAAQAKRLDSHPAQGKQSLQLRNQPEGNRFIWCSNSSAME